MPHGNECDNDDDGNGGGDGNGVGGGVKSMELTLIIQTLIDAVI